MGTPLNIPWITDYHLRDMTASIKSGWLTQGKYVQQLESDIAAYVGTKYAVAVSSGTAALHLSLLAHGIGKGDEVIVPAFSFIATANTVELTGARPVFVDIDADTLCINVEQIERAITKQTKAIIPVHAFGLPAEMDRIIELAGLHSLVIIEDAACAIGATYHTYQAGSLGSTGCFSFHGRKLITSGEGGMVTTDNKQVADTIRSLRSHGGDTSGRYVTLGYNYRMTDFQAAMLLGQVKTIDNMVIRRRHIAQRYNDKLDSSIGRQAEPVFVKHSYQSYHIIVPGMADKVIEALTSRGIEAKRGAQFIPSEPYYRQKYNIDLSSFPVSDTAYSDGIVIPIYQTLDNQQGIISCINHTVRENT